MRDLIDKTRITGASLYGTKPEPGASSVAALTGPEKPLGWSYNPSAWTQRLPIVIIAVTGVYISRYLAGYQLGHIPSVWEPFFAGSPTDPRNGTEEIIMSSVAKAWPVSDAAVGAYTYGIAHTVGGFASAAAAEGGPDLWEQMYRLNVLTTLNIFRAALPSMRAAGRGSLVAIGAGAAVKAPSGLGAYAGAKSAVHRLVESFADELKADRIRVNAILPSIIDTPQNRAAMPDADHTAWVRPREIADAIAFLLAEDASGVTGAFIPVSGRV